jgi:FkbM family methyltransferase
MKSAIKGLIRNVLRDRFNRTVVMADDPALQWPTLIRFLEQRSVDTALDIGANGGHFATELRQAGFQGRIISFEPLSAAFKKLEARAATDPLWTARKLALGRSSDTRELHVAANEGQSSSFLPMLVRHSAAAPSAQFIGTETVEVRTLDECWAEGGRLFLKLDVQGYEANVIGGATKTLEDVQVIQTETSLVPLYEGQPLIADMLTLLADVGFYPVGFYPAFSDDTSEEILQMDVVLLRR